MFSVEIHHTHGRFVARVTADCADEARRIAREDALTEGLILYRVTILGGPYGPPNGF